MVGRRGAPLELFLIHFDLVRISKVSIVIQVFCFSLMFWLIDAIVGKVDQSISKLRYFITLYT